VDDLRGANALLTGAAGGLGRHIADGLAAKGVRLALSGRHAEPLEELCHQLRQRGAYAQVVLADLGDVEQTAALIEQAEATIGPLDLLVNNAGVEVVAAYPAFTDEELAAITRVNLIAPMVLTRHVLPGMLARERGHIVMVSSLAGRGGNAYNVLYATTKSGLVGFTRSLRAELAGTSVGASVICPGFVARDGMYSRMQEIGVNAPIALRAVQPERVTNTVLEAIENDRPDALVTAWPMRPLLALQELAPRLAERIVTATGASKFFVQLVARTNRSAPAQQPPRGPARKQRPPVTVQNSQADPRTARAKPPRRRARFRQ
jgi:short-subunit dehydrogenase